MSKRSRRFQASKEAAIHPAPFPYTGTRAGSGGEALVPAMQHAIDEQKEPFSISRELKKAKDAVTEQVTAHGEGYLERAREQIIEVAGNVVTWGKAHPMRVVGAAAALIAVTGFLRSMVRGKVVSKAAKAAGIVTAARQVKKAVKSGVKARVRSAVKAVGKRAGSAKKTGKVAAVARTAMASG